MAESSCSAIRPFWKYDVFISFRGEDTRENFISHLYAALRQNKIETFIDVRLERGDEISLIFKAIEESRLSIVIFSKDYASSSWCLDELVHIVQCSKKNGHVVVPVFYHVNPSHVRKQEGSYACAFALHEKRFKETIVHQWRVALTTIANLSGWDSLVTRPESKLIEEIVVDILKKLNRVSPSEDFMGLVGLEKRIEKIKQLLSIGSPDVRTIGIWGRSGIGKTTLASVAYKRFASQFEGRCFLANVREESKKHGLNYLEEKLLAELVEEKNNQNMVDLFSKSSLRSKKFLIVLDDVNDIEQLDHLVGDHDQFGNGSRIIVTTIDKKILRNRADAIYKVEALDFDEARQLITYNAFEKYSPTMDLEYIELTRRVINYVEGLPLACKIMGSHLRYKSKDKWESELNILEEVPNNIKTIENVLKMIYDALDDNEKQIFLDIACFFKGENRERVQRVQDGCACFADTGMTDLIDRFLITVTKNNVGIHDLLQEMGQNIVRQESKSPGERSRLWNAQDVYHILENNTGTEANEGLYLDMNETTEAILAPTVFQRMENLRFLHISNSHDIKNCKVSFPQGLQTLPNTLRSLHWDAYPLSYLPSNFTGENLVELKMAYSELEELRNDIMSLTNLREIDLGCSKHLTQLNNLSKSSKIETINLKYCTSLLQVPSQIQHLEKVKSLNVEFCPLIKELPNLPKSLESLKLSGTSIEELPSSIGLLHNLKELHMKNCESLISLPDNFCKLKSLQYLNLSYCSKLEKLPKILEPMNLLTKLMLNKTAIKEIPTSWTENLVGLQFLNLDFCKNLKLIPNSIQNMASLRSITLRGCSKLKVLLKLPVCLRYFDSSGCTSLEMVSASSKTPGQDFDEFQLIGGGRFVFYDCFKLRGTARRHRIMPNVQLKILERAITLSKLRQNRAAVSSFSVCCPENKIPKWFKYQSEGSSLSIKLPQDWSCPNFLGFALCAVVDRKNSSNFDGDFNLLCRIRCVVDNNDWLSWENYSVWGDRLPSLGYGRWSLCRDFDWDLEESHDKMANSSHIFFWDDYSHLRLVNSIKEKNEMNPSGSSYNVTQVSFEFICLDKNREHVKDQNVNKCGVRFLYRQDAKKFVKTNIIPSRI